MEARGKRQGFAIAIALCAFLIGVGLAAAAGPKLGKSIKVGFGPNDVAVGDFDNDGRKDLAVANFASSSAPGSKTSISILAGKKDGKYKLVKTLNSAQPSGIEAARIGSGKDLDLVVSTLSNQIEVYKGGKGLKFSAPKTTAVPGDPRDLVTGDFNNDARTDVAVSRADSDDVHILYAKKGSKGFSNGQTYAGASNGDPIVSARLNGDKFPDLVTTNNVSGKLTVLLGKKKGGFTEKSYQQPNATAVTIADFDQDGNNDVAVACGTQAIRPSSRGVSGTKPVIALYKGSKSGKLHKDRTLQLKHIGTSFGLNISTARLNGDPDPDLVLGTFDGATRPARRAGSPGKLTILDGKHGLSFDSGKQTALAGSPGKFGLIAGGKSDSLAIPVDPRNARGSIRILAGK